jgi:hypothetical protein
MEIYLSYTDEDETGGKRLKSLLKPLAKNYDFTVWSRQDVVLGTIWQREMARHLENAWLFIPLLSSDFFASDRCQAETMAALRIKGKLRIVSILFRPCFTDVLPFENNPMFPNSEKPITLWNNQDKAWLQVQSGLLTIIDEMRLR